MMIFERKDIFVGFVAGVVSATFLIGGAFYFLKNLNKNEKRHKQYDETSSSTKKNIRNQEVVEGSETNSCFQEKQFPRQPASEGSHPVTSEENWLEGLQILEVLIHNVSHRDMVVSLTTTKDPDNQQELILARPKFSQFHKISGGLRERLVAMSSTSLSEPEIIRFQGYSRSGVGGQADGSPTPLPGKVMIPAGFSLKSRPVGIDHPLHEHLRVRQKQHKLIEGKDMQITGVYFPLLAVLIPKWLTQVSKSRGCQKVVLLVSGVGQPRNHQLPYYSNSTKETAKLMNMFLTRNYPELKVIKVHSDRNIFRYDENIFFVRTELLPKVEKLRNKLAEKYGEDWRNRLHITISFADGSPARISAISSSLRAYRPSYLHIWELKTFWQQTKICEDDVEVLSFEDIDTVPPQPRSEVDPLVNAITKEMQRFRKDFEDAVSLPNDINHFWLRKTKKPVLAVLLVQKADQEPKFYRGTNMEVSMPTGSLCAERNVIGTALADDLCLKREHLKMIAVLSVRLPSSDQNNVSFYVRGTDTPEQLHTHGVSGMENKQVAIPRADCTVLERNSVAQISFSGEGIEKNSVAAITSSKSDGNLLSLSTCGLDYKPMRERVAFLRNLSIASDISSPPEKTTVLKEETNPLKPCGACNEWLKKIADVNPDFKVITFTDIQCTGIYIEPV